MSQMPQKKKKKELHVQISRFKLCYLDVTYVRANVITTLQVLIPPSLPPPPHSIWCIYWAS